jgi:hypothetical protein
MADGSASRGGSLDDAARSLDASCRRGGHVPPLAIEGGGLALVIRPATTVAIVPVILVKIDGPPTKVSAGVGADIDLKWRLHVDDRSRIDIRIGRGLHGHLRRPRIDVGRLDSGGGVNGRRICAHGAACGTQHGSNDSEP